MNYDTKQQQNFQASARMEELSLGLRRLNRENIGSVCTIVTNNTVSSGKPALGEVHWARTYDCRLFLSRNGSGEVTFHPKVVVGRGGKFEFSVGTGGVG
tara:strand:- start:506 stop:802 length:297 start_codon:yes stop_codon:yes gene_type:complete